MSAYDYREAVLNNFLSDSPTNWGYDKVMEKLFSQEFYSSDDDPECPDDESLTIWEFYEDWNTRFLAQHIEAIVDSVANTLPEEMR